MSICVSKGECAIVRGAILADIGLKDPEESLVTVLSFRSSVHRGRSGEARRRFFGEVVG